ncbi:autoinducer kinase [Escherichia coli]|nr:autoinducer kinase [Escherichia coli]EFB3791521.1 autoinducer kinase [Escherichia coli]EFD5094415.1 autoinducer kinase [Escherichia coli]EFI8716890.1 autoinducer kinase [Escherichia coli]EFN5982880.1 autoinducer kinase [Escherichia coli]
MARLFTLSESKYYLMALDAGTGSIRAVIFDLEGNQIAVGQAEWRHLAVPDVPGSMEFDLNKNWQLACECMRQALHNAGIAPEYIAAVSACSMREGIVLYNNEGAPIWACANVDARAAREVSELKELHNNTFENEVYRATGQTLALIAIPRLLWLAHHRSDMQLASVPEFFHQWQKPENAWFAGNGRTHQTRKSMNFIRIHAISGRQFIRISWGWLIMD